MKNLRLEFNPMRTRLLLQGTNFLKKLICDWANRIKTEIKAKKKRDPLIRFLLQNHTRFFKIKTAPAFLNPTIHSP